MTESNPLPADPLHGQPHEIVERDGVRYTLLGTAHVSRASVDAVRAAVASGDYDSVAANPQVREAYLGSEAAALEEAHA